MLAIRSDELEYPYFSRVTLERVTSSDVANVRVSKSDTAVAQVMLVTTTLLSSAALEETSKLPDLTTSSESSSSLASSLHAAGQSL
jgi:hypothetical protein